MRFVRLEADAIVAARPLGEAGCRSILFDLDMTIAQQRKAIFHMLGAMPESDAYDWLKSEFPEWFATDDALVAALRRAVLALAFAAESSPAMQDDYKAVSAALAAAKVPV